MQQIKNASKDVLLLVGASIIASCLFTYSLFIVEVLSYKDEKISFNSYKVPLYGWLQQITDVLDKDKEVSK